MGQQHLYAYVTSDSDNLSTVPSALSAATSCSSSTSSLMEALPGESLSGDEPIPIPRDGEGGGDLVFIRDLYRTVFDVTPPNPPGGVVAQFRLSASGFLLDNVPALESMGLAVAPGTDLLYVVSPDTDSVFVFGTSTSVMTFVDEFAVGDKPSDVGIVKADTNGNGTQDEQDEDRAYVTSELGDSLSVFKVPDHFLVETVPLPGAKPVAVEVRKDGLRAYIANSGTNTVRPVRLRDNAPLPELVVPVGPRRISIQKP